MQQLELRGTTRFDADQVRDMEYLNTSRCAWIDDDGDQCETMIRKTSTHCYVHAAMVREAEKRERDHIERLARIPADLELVLPGGWANEYPEDARSIFRAAIVRNLARRNRVVINPLVAAAWRELTR